MADEKIDKSSIIKKVSLEYYEDEVVRRLLFIAVTARQMLDGKEKKNNKVNTVASTFCGCYRGKNKKTNKPISARLTFKNACDKIIHAVDILPYDKNDMVDDDNIALYAGKITIMDKQKFNAFLDMEKFSECCNTLSNSFLVAYKYHFKVEDQIVHTGHTTNLEECEQEHREKTGRSDGHVVPIGQLTTEDEADAWLIKQEKRKLPSDH